MNFLVSPSAKSNWRISMEELAAAARQDWPLVNLEVVQNSQSIYALSWHLEIDGRRLDGALTKDGTTLHLNGDLRDCAKFALWFRTKVPDQQSLLFYDEGFSADVSLSRGTTETDLVQPFQMGAD